MYKRQGYTKAERRSIGDVLADPITNQSYFDIVSGKANYIGEALMLRANHRKYHSRGIQIKGEYKTMLYGGYFTAEAVSYTHILELVFKCLLLVYIIRRQGFYNRLVASQ